MITKLEKLVNEMNETDVIQLCLCSGAKFSVKKNEIIFTEDYLEIIDGSTNVFIQTNKLEYFRI